MHRETIEQAIRKIETIGQSLDVPANRRAQLLDVAADLRFALAGLSPEARAAAEQEYEAERAQGQP